MTKRAVKRIIKKKRQLKKQVKQSQQSQQTQQKQMPMIPLGFGQQQYGNPDLAIQQMRNQNQMVTDQINNYRVTMDSMKKENDKKNAELKEYKKLIKEIKHKDEESKINLEIAKDQYNDMDSKQKQIEYFMDKTHQLQKEMFEQDGENNKFALMKQLEEQRQIKHEKEMEAIKQKQEIEQNKLAQEVQKEIDETKIIATKNQSMYEYISSDMFKNPQEHLSKAYLQRMKEEEKNDLLNKLSHLNKQNIEIVQQNNNNYESNSELMVEQIKNNIAEQNKLLVINQQENQLLKNQESTYNHLLDTQTKAINDTNDMELENNKLHYQFTKVNNQPEVYDAIQKQQDKLAKATAKNETLKTKFDILKKRKNIELENSMLEQVKKNIENGQTDYQIDDNDDSIEEEENENKKKKKTKQSSKSTSQNLSQEFNNTSVFDNQINQLVVQRQNLQNEQKRNQFLKQNIAEQEHHNQIMISEKAKQNVYMPNNNNNRYAPGNYVDNDDSVISQQADYQIAEQKTRNKLKERKANEQTQKNQLLHDLSEECHNESVSNVWRKTYGDYHPNIISNEGQKIDINNLSVNEIAQISKDFNKTLSNAPLEIKNQHDHFAKAHNLITNNNNDEFVEEEEEAEMESKLDDQTKLDNIFADIKRLHAEYDQNGQIWYNALSQQEYPNYARDMSIFEDDVNDLETITDYYNMYKAAIAKINNNE